MAMNYMHRINEAYKELCAHGKSSSGHIIGDLDSRLRLLDAQEGVFC